MGVIHMSDLPGVKQEDITPRISKQINMGEIPDPGTVRQKRIMVEHCRKVAEVFKQGQWKGQRCFILGGGRSVNRINLEEIAGEHIIGVNLAFRLIDPEIIYAMDARLWGWIENNTTGAGDSELFQKSNAVKVWSDITSAPLPEDIVIAPSLGRPGLSSKMSEGVACGSNSGFGALNLALLLGASEIYLIGYDFDGPRWHRGYPQGNDVGHEYHMQCYRECVEDFKKLFPNQKIINLNKNSKLKVFEFGDMPKDTLKKKPVVEREAVEGEPLFVSYYTTGNGYAQYAKKLERTLKEFNLAYSVQAVKSKGKWDLDTKLKPTFLLKIMEQYPGRPIVWLDADAIVSAKPEKLLKNNADIAVYINPGEGCISNVMYLSGNEKSKEFLEDWKALCEDPKNEAVWDQKLVDKVLKSFKGTVDHLPPEYCYMHLGKNLAEVDKSKIVIEQFQASRKLKR